jgi:hypothetical protein
MNTYLFFSAHLERNSLNIFQSEICLQNTLERNVNNPIYTQYKFTEVLTIFEISKKREPTRNVRNAYFS